MVNHRLAWRNSERGFLALIGLLVVIVIIGIMFATMYGPSPVGPSVPAGAGTSATTILGASKERAEQSVCRNNLAQFRQAVMIYQGNGEGNPPDLESLNLGLPAACPDGGEPYQYDPLTGQVHCIHPGHGSF